MTNHQQPAVQQKGELTEVTQVLRVACSCNICGQQFASFHALRTHIGKSHPETSIALTKENTLLDQSEKTVTCIMRKRGCLSVVNVANNLVGGQRLCPLLISKHAQSYTIWVWRPTFLARKTPLLWDVRVGGSAAIRSGCGIRSSLQFTQHSRGGQNRHPFADCISLASVWQTGQVP